MSLNWQPRLPLFHGCERIYCETLNFSVSRYAMRDNVPCL